MLQHFLEVSAYVFFTVQTLPKGIKAPFIIFLKRNSFKITKSGLNYDFFRKYSKFYFYNRKNAVTTTDTSEVEMLH